MEGRRPERGAVDAKRRSAEGWSLGRGAVAPPRYGGLGAQPPENLKTNLQICVFWCIFASVLDAEFNATCSNFGSLGGVLIRSLTVSRCSKGRGVQYVQCAARRRRQSVITDRLYRLTVLRQIGISTVIVSLFKRLKIAPIVNEQNTWYKWRHIQRTSDQLQQLTYK